MKHLLLAVLMVCGLLRSHAQVVNICTNPAAQQVLLGTYDPAAYAAATVINDPDSISQGIASAVSPDSLRATLNILRTFGTRNSASDTNSSTRGIGAARRWAYAKFRQISAQNGNRLLPSYLQFDTMMCSVLQHRNIFAVLPGSDTSDKGVTIIEGHIDSRTVDVCDTSSLAPGIDDNGSGTALVLELARVMSRFTYRHTIVFLLTIGEEQGLYGGAAFANFAHANGIQIKAVLNNDITGGIICGHTSSPPSCPGYENIDSTHVRLFSYGGFNSFHKQLSRYIKLQYKERQLATAAVPMGINIMTPEDRTGRGGDHIPFRQLSYPAMRFTSQNEDGNADVTSPSYTDRQHTSSDSIGIDINNDGIIDTFWVDFNYLARNTIINGNAAGMIGISPYTPDLYVTTPPGLLSIHITLHPEYLDYKIGIRTTTNDWDTVIHVSGDTVYAVAMDTPAHYIVSVSSVDANGVESLFSKEIMATMTATNSVPGLSAPLPKIELLQNKPNPADEATTIAVKVNSPVTARDAVIIISDIAGKEVAHYPISLDNGVNEITYNHGYNMAGTYIYTLVVDGRPLESKRMVFSN